MAVRTDYDVMLFAMLANTMPDQRLADGRNVWYFDVGGAETEIIARYMGEDESGLPLFAITKFTCNS